MISNEKAALRGGLFFFVRTAEATAQAHASRAPATGGCAAFDTLVGSLFQSCLLLTSVPIAAQGRADSGAGLKRLASSRNLRPVRNASRNRDVK